MYPIIKQLYILMIIKQNYIYSSFYVIFCFPFNIHYCVKIFSKHILLNMHDIQIMAKDISLPIRKLQKTTLFYLIMDHTKTRKLLLTGLKIEYNILILRYYIISFFTRKYQRCNIPFKFTFQEVFFIFSVSITTF